MADPPESDPKAPPQPLVMRDAKGRLLPGSKLVTPGRPISLANYIAKQTSDGREITDRMLDIWRGNVTTFKAREQLEAGKWLSDRLWGKAVDIQAIANLNPEGELTAELSELASQTLAKLAAFVQGKQIRASETTLDLLPDRGSGMVADEDPPVIPQQIPTVEGDGKG